jgi:hypothetical protein
VQDRSPRHALSRLFAQVCHPLSGKWTFFMAAKNASVFEKGLEHGVYLLKEVTTMATWIML